MMILMKYWCLLLLYALIQLSCEEEKFFFSEDSLTDIVYNGLVKYEENNTTTPLLRWAVYHLSIPSNLFEKERVSKQNNKHVCIVCAAVAKYFRIRVQLGIDRDKIVEVLTFACTLFKVQTQRVCKGLIEINIDVLLYILKNKNPTHQKICATVLQNFGCYKEHRSKWSVTIPKRTSVQPKNTLRSKKFYKILHLTDIHIDPLYEQGSNAACDEPLCCQRDGSNVSDPKNAAGKWGDYRNCDMSYNSFENFLQHIKYKIKRDGKKISAVYFTGDIIGHRIWGTKKQTNLKDLRTIYKMLKDTFGSIPVFPILGNHEPHPVNLFSPLFVPNHTLPTQWLFSWVAKEWMDWLSMSTMYTLNYGGYYTQVVKPGFRIIGLNSNVCYIYNWWLLYNDIDPFQQLNWLVNILAEVEIKNEVVHILSHIPPGDDTCIAEWTRQYHRIIERFSHIITGQFNGHTHYDELRIFYNTSNSKIINVAFNGGSFTSYSNLNPNYRVYEVNWNTHKIHNFHQWMFNLKEANAHPQNKPCWYKLYSFRKAYNLNGLENEDFEYLIQNMVHNTSLLQQYFRYKVRESEPMLLQGCNQECLEENLCLMVTTEVDNKTQCEKLIKENLRLTKKLNSSKSQ